MKKDYAGMLVIFLSFVTMITITVLDSFELIENDIILKAWVDVSYTLLVLGILINKNFLSFIKILIRKRPPGGPDSGVGNSFSSSLLEEIMKTDERNLKFFIWQIVPLLFDILLKIKKPYGYNASTALRDRELIKEYIIKMEGSEIKELLKRSASENDKSKVRN